MNNFRLQYSQKHLQIDVFIFKAQNFISAHHHCLACLLKSECKEKQALVTLLQNQFHAYHHCNSDNRIYDSRVNHKRIGPEL